MTANLKKDLRGRNVIISNGELGLISFWVSDKYGLRDSSEFKRVLIVHTIAMNEPFSLEKELTCSSISERIEEGVFFVEISDGKVCLGSDLFESLKHCRLWGKSKEFSDSFSLYNELHC